MEARAYVQEKDLVDQVNEALAELRMNKADWRSDECEQVDDEPVP